MLQKILVFSLIIFCQTTAFAASSTDIRQDKDIDATALVRGIINNEIKRQTEDKSLWEYRSRVVEEGNIMVYQVVETDGVDLKLKLSENGRSLTPGELRHELELLQELVQDPSEQEKLRRVNKEDADKAHQLMEILQPAFIYHVESTTKGKVVLGFQPNPDYQPLTREATVFHAMKGKMILNTQEKRLAEIQGYLIRDVKFGFGFLANLQKGGSFFVRQDQLPRSHWKITNLNVQIQGRALFFKNIGTSQKEENTGFRPLPGNFSLESGVSLLRRQLEEGELTLPDS